MKLKKEDYIRILFTQVVKYVNEKVHSGRDVEPELATVYGYITKTRKQLFEDKRKAYPITDVQDYYDHLFTPKEHAAYAKIMSIENELNDLDQAVIKKIMVYKDLLWKEKDSSNAPADAVDC